jgi:2-pyrone-4,6-dicarboxylate lactonase
MDQGRRDFLQDSAGLGAIALTSAALWRLDPAFAQSRVGDLPCPPPDPNPRPPRFAMPADAIDSHAHLFGPESKYPYSPKRGYTPPDATLSAYDALHRALGIARGVLIQPSVYGTDNSLMLDALRAQVRPLRAVVALEATVSDRDLDDMNALGVRGIRVNFVDKGGMPYDSLDELERLARRLQPFGWHVELLVHVHEDPALMRRLGTLPVDICVGHLGYMPAAFGADHPGFKEFLALMREGRCWVKLTGSYRITGSAATPYVDVAPLAQALVAARPDRIVWGTDWPHVIVKIPMPNDGPLLDQLADWVPDADLRRRILVDNPAALYRF